MYTSNPVLDLLWDTLSTNGPPKVAIAISCSWLPRLGKMPPVYRELTQLRSIASPKLSQIMRGACHAPQVTPIKLDENNDDI